MLKNGYKSFKYLVISKIIKEKPSQYAKAFLYAEIDENDLTYFIKFNLDVIIEAVEKFNQYIEKKKEENNNIYVALNRSDLYGELGAGFDFYTTFFKFGIELKMSYGLSDILKREGNIYTGAVDRLNSKLFLLSFTFE